MTKISDMSKETRDKWVKVIKGSCDQDLMIAILTGYSIDGYNVTPEAAQTELLRRFTERVGKCIDRFNIISTVLTIIVIILTAVILVLTATNR